MTAPRYVIVRTLPSGEVKTSKFPQEEKRQAAHLAAQSHRDNTGADRAAADEIYTALMRAIPSTTIGPFRGYSYRIDVWRVEP
jgi:hypothetical protein